MSPGRPGSCTRSTIFWQGCALWIAGGAPTSPPWSPISLEQGSTARGELGLQPMQAVTASFWGALGPSPSLQIGFIGGADVLCKWFLNSFN